MNNWADCAVVGLDLGSAYVKCVSLGEDGRLGEKYVEKTGYDFPAAVSSLLKRFKCKNPVLGVTGYGKNSWPGLVHKTEISALAKGIDYLGVREGTLVDIGGQDCKVLKIREGRLADHALNRRCAAGTGSYLEFIAHRLDMDAGSLDRAAAAESDYYLLNSFCTVFAGTEILDCMKKKVPLPRLIRGLYVSIVQRIGEIAPLDPPVFLSGGLVAHHPVLADIFGTFLDVEVKVVPHPQFLAAFGIALYAKEEKNE